MSNPQNGDTNKCPLYDEFGRQDLDRHFPDIEKKTLRRVITDLIKEGYL